MSALTIPPAESSGDALLKIQREVDRLGQSLEVATSQYNELNDLLVEYANLQSRVYGVQIDLFKGFEKRMIGGFMQGIDAYEAMIKKEIDVLMAVLEPKKEKTDGKPAK